MLRKTAFLVAYWGLILAHRCTSANALNAMDEANILQSARHKNISSTATYLSDSGTLKVLLDRTDRKNKRHFVGVWNPIHMKTLHQFAALNMKSNPFIKPIVELAKWWIFDVLGVQLLNIASVHREAYDYKPDLSVDDKMKAAIQKIDNLEMRTEIELAVKNAIAEHVKAAMNPTFALPVDSAGKTGMTPIAFAPDAAAEAEVEGEILNRKRKKPDPASTFNSLERNYQRECLAKKKGKDKIGLFILADAEAKSKIKATAMSPAEPLKSWLYRVGRVVDCVNGCHGSSIDAFLEANKGALSHFRICSSGQKHTACYDIASL